MAGAVTGVNSREHPPPPCQQRGIALQEARNRRHTTATCGDIVPQEGGKDQEPALRQKGNHAQTHYLIKWESDTLTSGDNEQHPYFLLKDHCGSFQFFQPTVLNLSLFAPCTSSHLGDKKKKISFAVSDCVLSERCS